MFEALIERLPHFSDEQLKNEYLTPQRWAPTWERVLKEIDQDALALRIIRLALEVDFKLGAKLAGAVIPEFQAQTVRLIDALTIPLPVKIHLLQLTHSEQAIPFLRHALNDEDEQVRELAAKALGELGYSSAIPALLSKLQDEYNSVCKTALKSLGTIGSLAVLPILYQKLKRRGNEPALEAFDNMMSQALAKRKSNNSEEKDSFSPIEIDLFLSSLNSDNLQFCRICLQLLWILNQNAAFQVLTAALQAADDQLREFAILALGKLDKEATIPILLQCLENENQNVQVYAANTLSDVADEAIIPELVNALNSEQQTTRVMASYLMAKIGTDATLPYLSQLFHDENDHIQLLAVTGLCKIASPATFPLLMQALQIEDEDIICVVAKALVKLGETYEPLVPEMAQALQSPHESIPYVAGYVLSQLNSPAALTILEEALEHPDPSIRAIAGVALSKHDDAAVCSAALQVLQEIEDYDLIVSAQTAFKIIEETEKTFDISHFLTSKTLLPRWNDYTEILSLSHDSISLFVTIIGNVSGDKHQLLEKIATWLVEILGEDTLPQLLSRFKLSLSLQNQLLDSPQQLNQHLESNDLTENEIASAEERYLATVILGYLGNPAAVPTLVKVLQENHCSLKVSAAEALARIGTAEAVNAILQSLNFDNDVSYPLVESLKLITNSEAISVLVNALDGGLFDAYAIVENNRENLRELQQDYLAELGDNWGVQVLKELWTSLVWLTGFKDVSFIELGSRLEVSCFEKTTISPDADLKLFGKKRNFCQNFGVRQEALPFVLYAMQYESAEVYQQAVKSSLKQRLDANSRLDDAFWKFWEVKLANLLKDYHDDYQSLWHEMSQRDLRCRLTSVRCAAAKVLEKIG
ncbi:MULTISPECIES: HEAT repeat domain-containing protein [unclassified Coleofasciculus]|uniref:HEAT repeat domain-containing protein n=1 Tax=unclassified Coleofasciculus TaxID=2692782 RepID=UPI00187FA67E|nr:MULTISPECIES: HEAT repeat domain-containing protein [unclassified Coleofasciculus]MBE9129356.1 HEAT repeat domain-containing protein [Coleofasciculus sp. LEGE 07081]MBE9151999.1 HEAT repeat domain-containing protein [Coleofasciculus sp. LEGE 07092]